MGTAYRIASASIVSEVIDGEAIIMDMGSGTYYSADGVGALIWEALIEGAMHADVLAWTASSFPEYPIAADEASAFLDQLVDDQLLQREKGADLSNVALAPMTCAWATPRLHRHEDMQDLIMMDPIHDVDEVGWPVRKIETGL